VEESTPNRILPNFCHWPVVLSVLVLCELFAIIVVLYQLGEMRNPWDELALMSLFMQWAGLSCLALLCIGQHLWGHLSAALSGLLSYLGMLAVILLLSEVSHLWVLGVLTPQSQLEHGQFLLRNMAIGAIICALVLRYFYVHRQWTRRILAESEARAQALTARMRPHFLFNTLNTVVSLVRRDPAMAETALLDLSDLMRASLGSAPLVTLEEELALVRGYLGIEQLRLGGRLQLEMRLGAVPGDALLPQLSLQPLVENAIYHGIETLAQGGRVEIEDGREGEQLWIEVRNPLSNAPGRGGSGGRLAQESIRLRLLHHFPDTGTLQVEAGPEQYRARLCFTYRSSSE